MAAFLRYKLLVVGGGEQRIQFARIFELDLQHPGVVRVFIYLLGRGGQLVVNLSHGSRRGRIQIRDRFYRFDTAEGLSGGNLSADFGQIHEHDVSQRFLRVVGDADGRGIAVGFDPLVFLGVLEVRWIGHLLLSAPDRVVPEGTRLSNPSTPGTSVPGCLIPPLRGCFRFPESPYPSRGNDFPASLCSSVPLWLALLRFSVKRSRHYLRCYTLTTNLDLQFGADRRQLRRNIGQRDVLFQERRVRSAGHVSDLTAAFVPNFVSIAGDSALNHLQTHERALQGLGLESLQRGPADELWLLHFAEAVEACLPHVDRIGNCCSIH